MNPKDFGYLPHPQRVGAPVFRPDVPKLTGRPKRETVISEDDILNLRIALNTFTSLDVFLEVT